MRLSRQRTCSGVVTAHTTHASTDVHRVSFHLPLHWWEEEDWETSSPGPFKDGDSPLHPPERTSCLLRSSPWSHMGHIQVGYTFCPLLFQIQPSLTLCPHPWFPAEMSLAPVCPAALHYASMVPPHSWPISSFPWRSKWLIWRSLGIIPASLMGAPRPSLMSQVPPIPLSQLPSSSSTQGLLLVVNTFSISCKIQLSSHLTFCLSTCSFLTTPTLRLTVQCLIMRFHASPHLSQLHGEENEDSYSILITYYRPKIRPSPS